MHFGPDGHKLTKKEKKLAHRRKEYDTHDSLDKGYWKFKTAWAEARKDGKLDREIVNESPYQQALYAELRSLGTPVMAIKMMHKLNPEMVIEIVGKDMLAGGGG